MAGQQDLQGFLFSEADRILKALADNKFVTAESHTQIMALLQKERSQGHQVVPSAPPKAEQPALGFPFGPPPPYGYNPYAQQQPGWGPPPMYAQPPIYPVAAHPPVPAGPYAPPTVTAMPPPPQSQEPPRPPQKPESHEPSKITQFAQQMGSNVVNSMSHGFGASIGMNAGNTLWHKLT